MDAELDVVNVIHIDDDKAVLDVTKRSLEREHPEMEVEGYLSPADALGNLERLTVSSQTIRWRRWTGLSSSK